MGAWRISELLFKQSYFNSHFRSTVHSSKETQKFDVPTIIRSTTRISSNLIAAGLVFLSLITVIILLNAGMFDRHVYINDITFDAKYMHNYEESCQLSNSGFLPNTCTPVEMSTVTAPAWDAISRVLAQQWVADAASPYYVTTCMKGPPNGWSSLIFLAGYDNFPKCTPSNGPQEVAGIASVETTIRKEYPEGAYILTVFADKTMPASIPSLNTDGTIDIVISNFTRTLISQDGVAVEDLNGVNTVITSAPLGNHYLITSYAYSTVLDISNKVDKGIQWWNTGRYSKKAVTLSWNTGHIVKNARELIIFQVLFSVWSLALVSSDVYLTFQGLQGFLMHKPVMTYDLLAGLERRRLLLVAVGLSTLPSLLYADVARIYRGTANGDLIWGLATILIGMHCAFLTIIVVCLVQYIPCPSKKILSFSPSIFSYSTILAIVTLWSFRYDDVAVAFNNDTPMVLGLNVSGNLRPAGSYTLEGADTVLQHMFVKSFATVVGCMVFSILCSMTRRHLSIGEWLLNTSWTKTNSFLDRCGTPRWITGLPLEQTNAIKIGNKLFCKPSTQAVLGFAVLVNAPKGANRYKVSIGRESNRPPVNQPKSTDPPLMVVSIYDLVPTLLYVYKFLPVRLSPQPIGIIDKNTFMRSEGKRIGHDPMHHHRGACVN